jgi:hypothetical protein
LPETTQQLVARIGDDDRLQGLGPADSLACSAYHRSRAGSEQFGASRSLLEPNILFAGAIRSSRLRRTVAECGRGGFGLEVSWAKYVWGCSVLIRPGNCLRLMRAAELLEVPVFLTEHCAGKIGQAVNEVRDRVGEEQILQKISFSTLREPRCRERLAALGRRSPVVAGTEAHVCVLQTALDLKAAGYAPRYVVDAVSSRRQADLSGAIARAQANGVEAMTVEMVLFEWLEHGDDARFGAVLDLIKQDR